jgi:selenocysteine-specific elongation factor
MAPELAGLLRDRLATLIAQQMANPAAAPLKIEEVRKTLELPDTRLVVALLGPGLLVRGGMIIPSEAPDTLAPAVRKALEELEERWAGQGLAPLTEPELAAAGLAAAEISAAVRSGRLLRLAPDVVLLPAAVIGAVAVLAGLAQPFTAGEAREALSTTRKVIVPLLEHLAAHGLTRRLPDGRHHCRAVGSGRLGALRLSPSSSTVRRDRGPHAEPPLGAPGLEPL